MQNCQNKGNFNLSLVAGDELAVDESVFDIGTAMTKQEKNTSSGPTLGCGCTPGTNSASTTMSQLDWAGTTSQTAVVLAGRSLLDF